MWTDGESVAVSRKNQLEISKNDFPNNTNGAAN